MSDFIFIEDPIQLMQTQPGNVIEGVVSRIVRPSIKSGEPYGKLEAGDKMLYSRKISSKFRKEKFTADHITEASLHSKYQKIKKNLRKYGKQQQLKLESVFQSATPLQSPKINCSHRGSSVNLYSSINSQIQSPKKPIDELLQWHHPKERFVFLDRKYSTEFAVRLASILEHQQIRQAKEQMIQEINKRYEPPLLQGYRQIRSMSFLEKKRSLHKNSLKKRAEFQISKSQLKYHNKNCTFHSNSLIDKTPVIQSQSVSFNPVLTKMEFRNRTMHKKRRNIQYVR